MRKTTLTAMCTIFSGLCGLGLTANFAQADKNKEMSFFVTSVSPGKGADLGGIEGADKHCQSLAQAAGAGSRTWHAYLSTQATSFQDTSAQQARNRIGTGPWYNAKGVLIAKNVEDLHSEKSNLNKETALDENGQPVNGRGDKPNKHDMLTGSRPDGTNFPPSPPFPDRTCGNWTKSDKSGSAMLGHHDRLGPNGDSWAISWNSAHPSLACDTENLNKTGSDALFYCFAVK